MAGNDHGSVSDRRLGMAKSISVCLSWVLIVSVAVSCHKKKEQSTTAEETIQGYTAEGEVYTCPTKYIGLSEQECVVSDETEAFKEACTKAGHKYFQCLCVQTCSEKIFAACPQDARVDCIKNTDGAYEKKGVGRQGFACEFPPVPENAVSMDLCN